ncbi:hypothetical protein QCA50_003399 [Cerrena zonata]|uniref:Uncharacterized protein n=1 Tax=Cerrena zonata TaxID=2478898 RepID=A0AAW0GPJ4_9APHY
MSPTSEIGPKALKKYIKYTAQRMGSDRSWPGRLRKFEEGLSKATVTWLPSRRRNTRTRDRLGMAASIKSCPFLAHGPSIHLSSGLPRPSINNEQVSIRFIQFVPVDRHLSSALEL